MKPKTTPRRPKAKLPKPLKSIEPLEAFAIVVKKFESERLEIDLDKIYYYKDSAEKQLQECEFVGRVVAVRLTPIRSRRK